MKSFAKVSLLFALIITGRYLQPAAPTSLATRPAPTSQALPLALARYTTPPQPEHSQHTQVQSYNGYFM